MKLMRRTKPGSTAIQEEPALPGGGASTGRRALLKTISAAGIGSAVFGRAFVALAEGAGKVTPDMLRQAEWISGLKLTREQRKLMTEAITRTLGDYAKLRAVAIDNAVPPALVFGASPGEPDRTVAAEEPMVVPPVSERPSTDEEIAFAPVTVLAGLLRARKISSVELTRLYLDRLERFDPVLKCVITMTGELALRQAAKADEEIAAGRSRGPLHGVPWGAKDLLAVPGYRTTWGAGPYKDQVRPEKAAVVEKLEEAGAVLLAKLAVGELAWGDVWFGGTTKNPWRPDQGSSGSSAGSASSTAAGLVGFAIGTETWGSIVSPCTRCGATGLRPTFGRVSRHGAMALAWSMDKVGPIARSASDLGAIFAAIQGRDARDPATVSRPFRWIEESAISTSSLKVGYVEEFFNADYTKWADTDDEKPGLREWQAIDRATIDTLRRIGVNLVPVKLPTSVPIGALSIILTAEAATAFDELTRSGRDSVLVRQVADAWPTVFRQGQVIPAVEYLRANRIRTLLMREMETLMEGLDAYVCPTYGGDNLLMTNLTGHPCVVLPNGFRSGDGTPTSISLIGGLHREGAILALARAFQRETDFHLKRPPLVTANRP